MVKKILNKIRGRKINQHIRSVDKRRRIEFAVDKVVKDYGQTLRMLSRE